MKGLAPPIGIVALALLVGNADASQLIIGLRNRGIFLQEFWDGDDHQYAIVNMNNSSATLAMRWFTIQDDGHHFHDPRYGPIERKWTLTPGVVTFSDAFSPDSSNLIDVQLDGAPLGLLKVVKGRPAESGSSSMIVDGGVNGWGGRSALLWIQQPARLLPPDSEVELTLFAKPGAGAVTFSDPRQRDKDLPLQKLVPIGLTSEVGEITEQDSGFVVRFGEKTQSGRVHEASLRVRTPAVTDPVAVLLYVSYQGEGASQSMATMFVVGLPAD